MEVSKNFELREFIPEDMWKRLGESAIWLIDEKIIKVAQKIRDHFQAPIYINTWMYRGKGRRFQWRGFRPSAYTKCAYFSQHKLGKAIDFNVEGLTDKEVQEECIQYSNSLGIRGIEEGTPTWTHVDVRNLGDKKGPMVIHHKVSQATKVR
jgi:hypothetical protein